jgi:5'-methylthioadenosine phosphorylase
MDVKPSVAIIGGSGIYALDGIKVLDSLALETPFGKPSSEIIVGEIAGQAVAFLARHGIGHTYSPSEVNYRANIYALKSMGVERVISISACGSLREDYVPGEIVVPDQLFDRTTNRSASFFEGGLVAHLSVADPFCPELSQFVFDSVNKVSGTAHMGGAYITIEGPRFSTRAESNTFRAWGMSIIGMTTSPEAFLAREAEMCYSVMAHVTDYDVWHHSEEPVTADMVFGIVKENTQLAQRAILNLLEQLPAERTCSCQNALQAALSTRKDDIPPETLKRLAPLVERYLE